MAKRKSVAGPLCACLRSNGFAKRGSEMDNETRVLHFSDGREWVRVLLDDAEAIEREF
jgi:hypothetical protein